MCHVLFQKFYSPTLKNWQESSVETWKRSQGLDTNEILAIFPDEH